MKILVTGGGSEEPIDNVRAVCNFSTGRTSAFLADYFAGQGYEVCEIVSERAVKAEKARLLTYKTFAQLAACLEKECRTSSYDLIVHAAAVSDYSPYELVVDGKTYACGEVSKVPAGAELLVKMKKNPKLVDSLKLWSGDKTKVVAFKLTSNASVSERQTAVKKVFDANKNHLLSPDFVVSNDLSEIKGDLHKFKILNRSLEVAKEGESLSGLAQAILELAGC
jgi:phosphopantothenoylcysteine synthetase/decarboxylase